MKVGYQGNHGTYSEIAALTYFEGVEFEQVGFRNFPSLFEALDQKEIDYALIPVENTTTGIISRTYDLFRDYNIYAVGEINVPITEDLVVCPGTTVDEIEEVYSHPEALSQCGRFFAEHPGCRSMAYQDTAAAVAYVRQCNDHKKAALASWRAAEYYGMESLLKSVQDSTRNMTRFLVMSHTESVAEDADKISMMFILRNHSGALYNVLGILAKNGIDIVRLESRPIPDTPFQYMFYIDFKGNIRNREIRNVIHELDVRCEYTKVFGCYKSHENIFRK